MIWSIFTMLLGSPHPEFALLKLTFLTKISKRQNTEIAISVFNSLK